MDIRNNRNIREHGKKGWCFFGELSHRRGGRIRVFGKIRSVLIDPRHVDMRVAVIREVMSGHVNLLGF